MRARTNRRSAGRARHDIVSQACRSPCRVYGGRLAFGARRRTPVLACELGKRRVDRARTRYAGSLAGGGPHAGRDATDFRRHDGGRIHLVAAGAGLSGAADGIDRARSRRAAAATSWRGSLERRPRQAARPALRGGQPSRAPTPISAPCRSRARNPTAHTLLIASVGLAANPSLYTKLGFDPLADLAPITLLANSPTVLVVPPALPGRFAGRIHRLRQGAAGRSSTTAPTAPAAARISRPSCSWRMTGTRMVHVPYGGGGPAALGAMTDQVQALFSSVLPVLGMIRGGTLKAIAIASEHRSALLPGVPTFAESGPGLSHRHLVRPARARAARRAAIVDTLHRATVAVLGDGERARAPRRAGRRGGRRIRRPNSAPSSATRRSGWRG